MSETKDHFASKSQEVNTSSGSERGLSISVAGGDAATKDDVRREPDSGLSATVDGEGDLDIREADASGGDEDGAEGDGGEGTDEDGASGEPSEALPEFNAEDADVVAKYDSRFIDDTGAFNMESLAADWAANVKDGDPATGSLSEGTYKWLETRGVTKEMAKAIEAGEVAKVQLQQETVFKAAGGEKAFNDARKWAREGGLTQKQIEKFNADVNGADQDARTTAVENLMLRFKAANKQPRGAGIPRRTTTSAGNAGAVGGGAAAQPFASQEEYRKAMKETTDEKDRVIPSKLAEVRARLRVSPWYKGHK